MKKILLCTTALFGLAAGSAFASEDVKVSFEGQSKFEAGFVNQDRDHKLPLSFSPNQKTSAFYTTQKASLKAEGKSDSLTYGAVLRLQMIGNGSDGMSDARNSRSHIYLDTDAGSVHLGSNFAASKLMQIDASSIAAATGGIDGDWTNFSNLGAADPKAGEFALRKANVFSSSIVTSVDTLSNRLDSYGESARKITYMSPRISGLQLGLSFAPDMNNTGGQNRTQEMYMGLDARVKNLWSLGLNYTNTFNDVNVSLSAVADRGQAVTRQITSEAELDIVRMATLGNAKINGLQTYSLGGMVGANGFSVAASYHNDGKSLTIDNLRVKSSWWTAGVAYENGPASVSLTYLNGKKENKSNDYNVKTQVVSLGADYEVAPGLKPFAEVTMTNFKPKNAEKEDKFNSTVFLMGTKLKF
jgi:predicted porin